MSLSGVAMREPRKPGSFEGEASGAFCYFVRVWREAYPETDHSTFA